MPFYKRERKRTARPIAQDWLHALLFEDWTTKLLAFGIALGLWYGVTSQRTPASYRLRGVQLDFLLPSDMEISNEPRDEVEVTLRGDRQALEQIVVRNLVARVDIGNLKPGERVARLSRESVTMDLPSDVHIEKIEPSTIPVRLERSIERVLPVEARLEGGLPEGYEIRGVRITPPTVKVRGPQSHVEALAKAPTESILLEGQTESIFSPQTAIDILDRRVVPLDPVVALRVEIGEERIEKSFAGVAVRGGEGENHTVRPPRATVTLHGPRSVIAKLSAEALEVVVEQTSDGSVRARLRLPPDTDGRV
ncbi:MAG TPA: CdaR family protein, partial [Pyrinomonadaceae bacterium]|nr:CdaR family protein [Pyrinomonadaceae bacterium]